MKKVSCFLVVAGASIGVAQAQYNVTDLTPGSLQFSQGNGIGGGQQVGFIGGDGYVWSGTPGSGVNLTPGGFTSSAAYGASGGYQVGYGVAGGVQEALMWHGTAASAQSLNPNGWLGSIATGISGSYQVGYGATGTFDNPTLQGVLWSGTANSAQSLNIGSITQSVANYISGTQIVGSGLDQADQSDYHALVWDLANSYADLNPNGATGSQAFGADATQEVGQAIFASGQANAMLWTGTDANGVDLNPAGFQASIATGIFGNEEVGYGEDASGNWHALLWYGSNPNAIELTTPGFFTSTYATGIDANGDIVGYGNDDAVDTEDGGVDHTLLWTPAPGPAAAIPFAIGLLRRRRRRAA